jgi:hypothetical protein
MSSQTAKQQTFKKNCKRMTEVFILTKDSKGSTSRFSNPRNPSAKTQCTNRLRQKRNWGWYMSKMPANTCTWHLHYEISLTVSMQWQISMRLQRLLLNNTSKVTGISVPPNPKTKHDKNKWSQPRERESLSQSIRPYIHHEEKWVATTTPQCLHQLLTVCVN